MNTREIFILDDDRLSTSLLKAVLEKEGYTVKDFTDPRSAISAFKENPSPVFVTDLNMPGMSGKQVIEKVSALNINPVFVVLTSENDAKTAAGLMKYGVYDYITKPFNQDEIVSRLYHAYEFAEYRRLQSSLERERELRIENQLNWNLWKESIIKRDTEKVESDLIGSLNTNLVQGAGIGLLTSLIQLIKQTAVEKEDHYEISKDIINLLFENTKISEKLTNVLAEIDYIIRNPVKTISVSLKDIAKLIKKTADSLSSLALLKNHSIKTGKNSKLNDAQWVSLNSDFFGNAVKEILINAMKFSKPETSVYVLYEIQKSSYLTVSFLSHPEVRENEPVGISQDYQNLIFEPFFRISKIVQEHYGTLDFGLGLTQVQKTVKRFQGKVSAFNLKNSLDALSKELVCISIELPIKDIK